MMKHFFLLILFLFNLSAHAQPGLLNALGLSDDFDTPPTVDEAFQIQLTVKDPTTLVAHWIVAEGNYLYKDKIGFELVDNPNIELGTISLPEGENKHDEIFGLTEVYHHDISVVLPLNRSNTNKNTNTNITLKVDYQGCSETFGICYPPTEKQIKLLLPAINKKTDSQAKVDSIDVQTNASLSQQDKLANSLANDNLTTILLSFLGLGLLLSFTPCVLPMIPILSGIIIGQSQHITTRRAFILSLSYVLAMSLTYTVAGVITGLLGENLQAIFQNPWVIISFSGLFIVFALSMFGLFELQLPQFLQNRLYQMSNKQRGGNIVGAATMGLLSGLIVGPCLAPPLAGALIFIGQQGDPLLGGSALFALSMGMGLPLLLIGTSAGTLLPKAGQWMNTVKAIFGVMMLSLAIWMLERIIPAWVGLLLWGSLSIIIAIYLGALNSLHQQASGWQKLWKSLGVILLVYGSLLIIGGSSGGNNVWQPLDVLTKNNHNPNQTQSNELEFEKIESLSTLQQKLNNSNQPSVVDFYADWCVECKRVEATTFKDTLVINSLTDFQKIQIDVTDMTEQHREILKHFGLFGPPTLLFFNSSGEEWKRKRLIGMVDADQLTNHITNLNQ